MYLASFREVDKLSRMVEKVWVSLFKEEDVGLVLAKERNTGGVDGAKFLQVLQSSSR